MDFQEKAGTVDFNTPKYSWTQTIDDVQVTVPVPEGTRGRDLDVQIRSDSLRVKLKSQPDAIIDGSLCGAVKTKESVWTLEDNKIVSIQLTKAISHDTWQGLVKGEYTLDPHTAEQMQKKMMLEKFSKENPGFDFSGAEFSGSVPQDPKNFMKFD
eukprot:TRINITY_DN12798_c0_g1_i1.p1 TRINITY_DN12798_c0_g1~~TRINITY_DN12798_c0_g1_i1.p1  ORF type:complete len:155 (+),score=22.91 TRINITY_DN12798_c0_g1_i1:2-466(+)